MDGATAGHCCRISTRAALKEAGSSWSAAIFGESQNVSIGRTFLCSAFRSCRTFYRRNTIPWTVPFSAAHVLLARKDSICSSTPSCEHAFAACMSPVLLPSLAPCSLLLGSGFAMKCRLKQPVLRYANGRIKPVSKTQAKQDGINSEFHEQGLSYSRRKRSYTHKLRALRQVSFPELCSWSPKKCEAKTWGLSCFQMHVCKGFGRIDLPFAIDAFQAWLARQKFFGTQAKRLCWSCRTPLRKTGTPPRFRQSNSPPNFLKA